MGSSGVRRRAARLLYPALLLLGVGCTASITASTERPPLLYSYPVAYVDAPPPRLQHRPRVYYRGRPAYLVGSRWYYPANGAWVYFKREPDELRDARLQRRLRDPAARERPRIDERRYRRTERSLEPPRETRRRRHD